MKLKKNYVTQLISVLTFIGIFINSYSVVWADLSSEKSTEQLNQMALDFNTYHLVGDITVNNPAYHITSQWMIDFKNKIHPKYFLLNSHLKIMSSNVKLKKDKTWNGKTTTKWLIEEKLLTKNNAKTHTLNSTNTNTDSDSDYNTNRNSNSNSDTSTNSNSNNNTSSESQDKENNNIKTQLKLEISGLLNDLPNDGESIGYVSEQGLCLMGSTYWFPVFDDAYYTYQIKVTLPKLWNIFTQNHAFNASKNNDSLSSASTPDQSQIENSHQVIFNQTTRQEEIILIAAPFKTYKKTQGGVSIQVWLNNDNPELAQNYLDLSAEYIEYYSKVIAPYPYSQFIIIENSWETGYGLPSATLLGPTVLKLPFILKSSLPHEILHNWWGNSVYIDFETGNWSEGLTTYMADHWQQSVAKKDAQYRQAALLSYSKYINKENDFPLRDFKAKHNEGTQAIGYNKSMMLFHMLKYNWGDDVFYQGMQDFYNSNKFKRASFDDIKNSFKNLTTNPKEIDIFFDQWVNQKGAPHILIDHVTKTSETNNANETTNAVEIKIKQKLNSKNLYWHLNIPINYYKNDLLITAEKVKIKPTPTVQNHKILTKENINQITIDQNFDLFRILSPDEQPITLSSLFSAKKITLVTAFEKSLTQGFLDPIKNKIESKYFINIKNLDKIKKKLPSDHLVVLGNTPEIRDFLAEQLGFYKSSPLKITDTGIVYKNQTYLFTESDIVFSFKGFSKDLRGPQIFWFTSPLTDGLKRWSNRLTHYGKSGILIFKSGQNVIVQDSLTPANNPLVISL